MITFSSADVQITGAAAWRQLSIFSWQILRQRSKLTSKAARSHNGSPASALMPTELWSCGFEQQTPDLRSCSLSPTGDVSQAEGLQAWKENYR